MVLTTEQRSQLEKTVMEARRRAEAGARNALLALAVEQAEPFPHLTPAQRELRRRLRAKARVLGDALPAPAGALLLPHLSQELAYEYWHQMLFARFLEANELLMYAAPHESLAEAFAVSLDDAVALRAEDLGVPESSLSKWSAAAALASRMLPAIFRPDDPLLQVTFAPDDRIRLEGLLDGLDAASFRADDSLGWVYQFWQAEAKKAINDSGAKIDGARLPAVTQLFTEPYMVQFLLDNTLGAWWTARHPHEAAPVAWPYLRRLPDGQPAAGSFAGWPATTAEVTLLDPCMGSGHFVAAAFPMLAQLRMHEEQLSATEATDRVLTDNLHGLELDARCTQIAAFNLALTAWKFCGGYRPLPPLNLACSGLAPTGRRDDWERLATGLPDATRLRNGLGRLYDLFQQAPELGSLIDPTAQPAEPLLTASFEELRPVLEQAIAQEHARHDDEQAERGVIAQGIAQAGRMLAQKYTLLITNVPYLSRGKQADGIISYCDAFHKEAKGDLATVFLARMINACTIGGTACSVIPQNWLFLTSYKKFREYLLKNKSWAFVAKLGARSFQTPMFDFNVMLLGITNDHPNTESTFFGVDASEEVNAENKAKFLYKSDVDQIIQKNQLRNPDAAITATELANDKLLGDYISSYHGITTTDYPRFGRFFWEIRSIDSAWIYQQSTVPYTTEFGGLQYILHWEKGVGAIKQLQNDGSAVVITGLEAWGKRGISINQMNTLNCSYYSGSSFDTNVAILIPKETKHLPAIAAFCFSPEFNQTVRKLNQSVKVEYVYYPKVPFDLAHWQQVAAKQYPDGLPLPYSDDPTQWLFHGHPEPSTAPLQVALARLLGYLWPAETDAAMELAPAARAHSAAIAAHDHLTDQDGILCLPAVNNEPAAADALRRYLQAVYGAAYTPHTLDELLRREGSPQPTLAGWLRDEFFAAHCKLFQQRPFLWHVSDGRKDGFAAIVNYHLLTKANLSKLIYTYLGDYLRQVEQQQKRGESGAEGRLVAARDLEARLKDIYAGDSPLDIFVRWKPLARQPLGWEPDLNDGVRLNIRPFVLAKVLRGQPKIKWEKDRGNNPPSAPWGVARENDRHLTLAEKQAARP